MLYFIQKIAFQSVTIHPLFVLCLLAGCSPQSNEQDPQPDRKDNANMLITGKVVMLDGVTPVSQALVYIDNSVQSSAGASALLSNCAESDPDMNSTCSDADGEFGLITESDLNATLDVSVTKGVFRNTVSINVTSDTNDISALALPVTPIQGGANLAVVTGQYDDLQNILAKLGYADLDPQTFQMVLGTETFQLYDGDNSLDDGLYPNSIALFMDTDNSGLLDIYDYDIVFFNCTSLDDYYHLLADPTVTTALRDYVLGGGSLYFTDLTYNLLEAAFAEVLDFYGSSGAGDVGVEILGEANVGRGGFSGDVTINDTAMLAWMDSVSCNPGPCLNLDQTVSVTGYLEGWTVLEGFHLPTDSSNLTWVQGNVEWRDNTGTVFSGNKPLTVTFDLGLGSVLFSSYHVHVDNQSAEFSPQERLLQYMIFEM